MSAPPPPPTGAGRRRPRDRRIRLDPSSWRLLAAALLTSLLLGGCDQADPGDATGTETPVPDDADPADPAVIDPDSTEAGGLEPDTDPGGSGSGDTGPGGPDRGSDPGPGGDAAGTELPRPERLAFDHVVDLGGLELRFSVLELTSLHAAAVRSEVDGPALAVPLTLANTTETELEAGLELVRLVDAAGTEIAPANTGTIRLQTGAVEGLEAVFPLGDTDLTGHQLRVGLASRVPVLIALPDGPVRNTGYPRLIDTPATGTFTTAASPIRGPVELALRALTVSVDVQRTDAAAPPGPGGYARRGSRYLDVRVRVHHPSAARDDTTDGTSGDTTEGTSAGDGGAPPGPAWPGFISPTAAWLEVDGAAVSPLRRDPSRLEPALPAGRTGEQGLLFEVPLTADEVVLVLGSEQPLRIALPWQRLTPAPGEVLRLPAQPPGGLHPVGLRPAWR